MSTDNLFGEDVGVADSPKLAWKKKHGILTWYDDGRRNGMDWCPPQWFAGFQEWWPTLSGISFFWEETSHNGDSRIGEGESEDDALANLMTCGHARQRNMRLWHEEQL